MVTGIETAGLVLALLPLLVNQLDNYVQGLETLKGFTAKRYRRELAAYLANLGAQQAIFINTLEQAFDGVIDDEDEIRRWMRCPDADEWERAAVQDKLEERLGRSFDPFIRTTTELSILLEDIASKLDLKDASTVQDWHMFSPSALGKEVKKFRNIVSKSIYAELFSKVHTANSILRTLVEQSHHRSTRKNKGVLKRLVLSQTRARASASSLYKSIMSEKCWKCACRDQHSVHFSLNASLLDNPGRPDESQSRFRMIFGSKRSIACLAHTTPLHEVEATSHIIPDTTASSLHESRQTNTVTGGTKAKVRFQIVTAEGAETQHEPKEDENIPAALIQDICSKLTTVGLAPEQPKLLGCVADERYTHNVYYLRTVAYSVHSPSQSLAELVVASSKPPHLVSLGKNIFSRRDRLILAVRLACSVFTLHGSWLGTYWRTPDIMFPDESQTPDRFNNPYIVRDIANGDKALPGGGNRTYYPSPLIRNETLFSLGLILVELSLCQTLEALRTSEDTDALETVTYLKTAARCLPAVEMESGLKYGEVVNYCLFGLCPVGMTLDNEAFQAEVCQTVINPLVENLRDFDGRRYRCE
ncbi:hypothetical protein BJY01DRAFT_224771 [Aspergillus pseudoustus]|uniref:DUF7580 domain-containing protein n=1 Tax=Aspergillus pseudoustus TaxID=1810923 RepID=A0ABR4J1P5_9EURO